MKRVVFTWEAGAGLGHIVPYLPLIQALRAKGHEVIVLSRDLTRAAHILGRFQVPCLQAPVRTSPVSNPVRLPHTYAHVLHNLGFDHPEPLAALVMGWRHVFAMLRPDVILFEHSPTALLAGRGLSCKKLILGSGFMVPPLISPLPNLRLDSQADPARLQADEGRVLSVVNAVLKGFNQEALTQVADLFANLTTALTTYPEVDAYQSNGSRGQADYFGVLPSFLGQEPAWSEAQGKKVFAYVKPFPALPALLTALVDLKLPSLIFMDRLDRRLAKKFASPTLRFSLQPLRMDLVAQQADLAILNGTHTTACQMLLAGKPILNLPIFLEQAITAKRIEALGAGLSHSITEPKGMEDTLRRLADTPALAEAAKAFATKHAQPTPGEQAHRLISKVLGMVEEKQTQVEVQKAGAN